MTPRDEISAVAAAQAGDVEARKRLMAHYWPVATRLARRLANRAGRADLADDLAIAGIVGTEGSGGLVRAIETFDAARGVKFMTHASRWLNEGIYAAFARELDSALSVSAATAKRWMRALKIATRLEQALGRPPEDEEIAAAAKLPLTVVVQARAHAYHTTAHAIDPEDLPEASASPEILAAIDERDEIVNEALDRLTPEHADLIRAIYGFGDDRERSVGEAAALLGISKPEAARRLAAAHAALAAILMAPCQPTI